MNPAIRLDRGRARRRPRYLAHLTLGVTLVSVPVLAASDSPDDLALARIDLATRDGADAFSATWRYADARIVEVPFRGPGPDGQPTGAALTTWDVEPRAGAADFDDSAWEAIAPEALGARRGSGRLCFGWYRVALTVPERLGDIDPTGATAVFQTTLDDYAEVWVDGELPRPLGQRGGPVVAGFNAPNRLVVGRDLRPGQRIQLAVFAANGPLSSPPTNFLWMREAHVDLFPGSAGPRAIEPHEVNVDVVRLDPRIDAIVPANPKLYELAEGFQFTEGPVWVRDGGYLLFSDPNANRIYRWRPPHELTVFRDRSGYQGDDVARYRQPGSNGLALDDQGRLVIDEHGNRRVTRLERDGSLTVLADRFDGKRLNSPNDLTFRSDGSLYFTDPPFGLPGFHDDPARELPFSGIYRLPPGGGSLELLSRDLAGPNGIALSPDERFLYVSNWDEARKIVLRFPLRPDGRVGEPQVFADLAAGRGAEALDGLEVDRAGNLYVSGPGGTWIFAADGTHLGTIVTPRLPANYAWGDEDGRTLYLTARTGLYRMPLLVPGVRP